MITYDKKNQNFAHFSEKTKKISATANLLLKSKKQGAYEQRKTRYDTCSCFYERSWNFEKEVKW